jgi:hypothetical protein
LKTPVSSQPPAAKVLAAMLEKLRSATSAWPSRESLGGQVDDDEFTIGL